MAQVSVWAGNLHIAWVISFAVLHIEIKPINLDAGFNAFYSNSATWYLYSMIFAMLILYPIMKLTKENFKIISIICFVSLMGITYRIFDHLDYVFQWYGFITGGIIRALMGITGGCICYYVVNNAKKYKFTKFMRFVFTLLEITSYCIVILYILKNSLTKFDWILVLIIMFGTVLSFSGVCYTDLLFNNKLSYWLGEYSFSIYLSHIFWVQYLLEHDYLENKFIIYLCCSFITSLIVMYLSKGIRYLWKNNKNRIRKIIFE